MARPFAGLPTEPAWVALREILPAASVVVPVDQDALAAALSRYAATGLPGAGESTDPTAAGEAAPAAELPTHVTIATVLPMAWPGLHRADGTLFVATQSGASSGDASRDLAAALVAAAALPAGTALDRTPPVTADTPRLQDLLAVEPGDTLEPTLHDGFNFWVGDTDLDEDAAASLERANSSIIPMTEMTGLTCSYAVTYGERTYIRVVLPDDEDRATDALARLHAAGTDALGEGTRLLGAFRACGLLVPVLEVPLGSELAAYDPELAAWGERYAAALAVEAPLTADERRARSGLLGRQVTLR